MGEFVAAPWSGGTYYLGRVVGFRRAMVLLRYWDDKRVRSVARSHLVETGGTFDIGDKVLAAWTTWRFYPGTITAVKSGGRYTVAWDDGGTPLTLAAYRIIAR